MLLSDGVAQELHQHRHPNLCCIFRFNNKSIFKNGSTLNKSEGVGVGANDSE